MHESDINGSYRSGDKYVVQFQPNTTQPKKHEAVHLLGYMNHLYHMN